MANRRRNQRGNSLLEFSMCWLFLVPLLCGMVVASVVVNRYVQTMTVSRDAGHMFARWVDFSLSSNKQLVCTPGGGARHDRRRRERRGVPDPGDVRR